MKRKGRWREHISSCKHALAALHSLSLSSALISPSLLCLLSLSLSLLANEYFVVIYLMLACKLLIGFCTAFTVAILPLSLSACTSLSRLLSLLVVTSVLWPTFSM